MDFDRAVVIPTRDVEVGHGNLQDSAIEAFRVAVLGVPGIFEGFVRLEIFPCVEQS
jgi:hypothetical protein